MKIKEINIYGKGLIACSVCVIKGTNKKEIEKVVNDENPTGIDSKWKIHKGNFVEGEKNPHDCEKDKNREHYLLTC